MGTYTTNYNLFMPTVGEQGWGELVNGNFATIDTTMKGLDTRVGTLETDTDAMKEKLDAFSVDTDGNIVGTFKGNVIGNVTGNLNGKFNVSSVTTTAGDLRIVEATFPTESGSTHYYGTETTLTLNGNVGTVTWYNTSIIDFTGNADDVSSTCTVTVRPGNTTGFGSHVITITVINKTTNTTVLSKTFSGLNNVTTAQSATFNRNPFDTYTIRAVDDGGGTYFHMSTSTPKKTFYVA